MSTELEQDGRAINAEPWEPLPGMVKRAARSRATSPNPSEAMLGDHTRCRAGARDYTSSRSSNSNYFTIRSMISNSAT